MTRRYLILAAGIGALATAVVFVKMSALPPGVLATSRLLLGALLLWPIARWETRRRAAGVPLVGPQGAAVTTATRVRASWVVAIPAAVLLAGHFVSWFVGVRMTTAANATLVVNLSPVAMPFALYLLVGERVTPREVAGSMIAVAGVALLAADSAAVGRQSLIGDLICVGSMVLAVCYMVLARRNATGRGIVGYLVPLYALAGTATLAYALASGEVTRLLAGTDAYDWPREVVVVVLLAVIPTAFGHSVLNYAMVHLRGQVVAVANLGQIAVAAVLAWLVLAEVPAPGFYGACVLIAAGAGVVIFRPRRRTAVQASEVLNAS